jgi:AcrR family transcriptional regulator
MITRRRAPKGTMARAGRGDDDPEVQEHQLREIRNRILLAFERRARTQGIRAIRMGSIATELGISTRRIYECFPGKADIIHALMERWAAEWEEGQRAEFSRDRDPVERLKDRTTLHLKLNRRFSAAFWIELERDYPAAYQMFAVVLDRIMQRIADWLDPKTRLDLPAGFASAMLLHFITLATRTHEPWPFSTSREDAIRAAVDIWAYGALRRDD